MRFQVPQFINIEDKMPVALLTLALAFFKPNGKPFVFMLQSAITYAFSNRLYIWRRMPKQMTPSDAVKEFSKAESVVPSLSESKLKDLTWALDINQNVKTRK